MAKSPTTEKLSKTEIARRNSAAFEQAYDSRHEQFVKDAIKHNKYYLGEQWDPSDKAQLEAAGRPALTLNMVLPTVNAIIGEQLERKVDITLKPDAYSSRNTAFAMTKLMRHMFNYNSYDDVEEQVFADGLIADRGYFDIRLDFSSNINGDITISSEDPIDIIPDRSAKNIDPSTWNEVWISRWMTIDRIEEEYGFEVAENLRNTGAAYGKDKNLFYEFDTGTFGDGYESADEEEARALARVRIVERQYYKLVDHWFLVDTETGDIRPAPFHYQSEDAVRELAESYGLGFMKRRARRVRMTASVDDVLIYDDWSLYRSFTVVPFFPYFRRGTGFGVVRNLVDSQDLLNKTSSQELHIVNTTANSGWIVEEGSLVDMEVEDLEERGAETGLVLQYKRNAKEPQKIQPNQIPTGIERISQKAAQSIREISAVNASMLGAARADMSGKAQDAATARGQVSVSVVLNNLKKTRRMVAMKCLELVQDFYDDTRYFSVVEPSMFGKPSEQEYAINVPDDDGNILNDVTLGKYTVEVGHTPAGGSQHDIEYNEALRLREMGVAIPDHMMVRYSNLTQQDELVEFLKNAQGYGEPTEEEAELQSLQIEHQINMLRKELEDKDADIQLKLAKVRETMMKADSLDGFNQAKLEWAKLEQQRELNERDINLRIALAARSHQNQNSLNDKRISSQLAMKSMDFITNKEKNAQQKITQQKGSS